MMMTDILHNHLARTAPYHFCRLTGLKNEELQEMFFTCGNKYAEEYCKIISAAYWEELSKELQSLSEFWKWWETCWNLRISAAFSISGIEEKVSSVSNDDSLLLLYAFGYAEELDFFTQHPLCFQVAKTFKTKIYENEKLRLLLFSDT